MKKVLSFILLASVLLGMFAGTAWAADGEQATLTPDDTWYTEHTDDSVYEIKTAEQLAGLDSLLQESNSNYFTGKTVKLCDDIDMSGYDWCNASGIFAGTFDGQGHIISGLTITGNAMFRYAAGEIKNFTLSGVKFENSNSGAVGAIVGDRNKTALKDSDLAIVNVHVVSGNVKGSGQVGGILGNTNGGSGSSATVRIENCSFSGNISGTSPITGGIVGYAVNTGSLNIENCTFNGNITSTPASSANGFGGIVGCSKVSTTVNNSSFKGKLTVSETYATYVGGIIGQTTAADKLTVSGCVVDGSIFNSAIGAGGIIGFISNTANAEITSCYANIEMGGAGNHKGGLIGRITVSTKDVSITANNCLISGTVTSSTSSNLYLSGFIGWIHNINNKLTLTANNNAVAVSSGHQNFAVLAQANADSAQYADSTYTFNNVWYDSSLITTDIPVFKDNGATNSVKDKATGTYGGKSTEELTASLTLNGWISITNGYPLPSAVVENSTFCVGYQIKSNADGSKDVRFIFGLKNLAPENICLVGAKLSVNGSAEAKSDCSKVYASVSGGGISYSAEQYGADYLFAVVLEGVPSDVTEFSALVKPYVSVDGTAIYDNGNNDSISVSVKN